MKKAPLSIIGMRQEYLSNIDSIQKIPIRKTFKKSEFPTAEGQLQILISSSITKILMLNEELLANILDKRWFASLCIMRTIIEELILLCFVLSKLQNAKSHKAVAHILERVSRGMKTKIHQDIVHPYNIARTMEEAEKFIRNDRPSLADIFDSTYTFITEYVHPNAPSRFHFHKPHGEKVRITSAPITSRDVKMLLNYGCMLQNLYLYIMKRLYQVKLPDKE